MTQRFRIFAALLAICLLATACAKKQLPKQEESRTVQQKVTAQTIADTAEQAWNTRDYATSELYYQRLLARTDISASLRPLAYERLVISALESGHGLNALDALKGWASLDPTIEETWGWNERVLEALALIGDEQGMVAHLATMVVRNDMDWTLKKRAADRLAAMYVQNNQMPQALDLFRTLREQAPDRESQIVTESEFRNLAEQFDNATLAELLPALQPDVPTSFPVNIIQFEQLRRSALEEEQRWAEIWQQLKKIASDTDLEDTGYMLDIIAQLEKEKGLPRLGIAFILPLSGRFGEVGWRIMRGAGVAQWALLQQGVPLEIKAINSEASNWLAQVKNLPAHFTLGGGPLRRDRFTTLSESGELANRRQFVFMPSTADSEEGKDVWRFFGSMEDQIRSVLHISTQSLGIDRFAILYPNDNFGLKASQLFWQQAREVDATVNGLASYNPKDPKSWGRDIAKLLSVNPKDKDGNRPPAPDPDFDAVFIPDGWAQAQLLVPHFFFHEEDRLLFLGPELWSQALARSPEVESRYFRLAACPGAWWPQSDTPGMLKLKTELANQALGEADFWIALGYDFVNLTASLGPVSIQTNAAQFNEQLSGNHTVEWSLAPFTWDHTGKAHQELYLFRPSKKGQAIVNAEQLSQRLQFVRQRHQERLEQRERKREMELLEQQNATNGTAPAMLMQDITE